MNKISKGIYTHKRWYLRRQGNRIKTASVLFARDLTESRERRMMLRENGTRTRR